MTIKHYVAVFIINAILGILLYGAGYREGKKTENEMAAAYRHEIARFDSAMTAYEARMAAYDSVRAR